MCTVTVVPCRGMVRLACNRDEQRCRPAALPPRLRRCGRPQAIFPVDPLSGGTWIAVNDASLALALLNVNDVNERRPGMPGVSRGTIIPWLLHADSLTSVLARASALDPSRFAPFRLIVVDRHTLAEVRSEGERMRLVRCVSLRRPHLFTSSGLGNGVVEGPRRRLFTDWFRRPDEDGTIQDAFHRHRWPDRPEVSVCMSRPDARTVSYTVVKLTPDDSTLTYYPDAPDREAEPITLAFAGQCGGVA